MRIRYELELSEIERDVVAMGAQAGEMVRLAVRSAIDRDSVLATQVVAMDDDLDRRELSATETACRAALGDLIYGQDQETLQEVVGRMLKASGKTVSTAESCTGGLVAKYLTDIPGSSGYFKQGWVTYSNEAKQGLLGVSGEILGEFGAVSESVARAMAEGARERAGADYAVSLSGIAGPDGGTPAKPVGTVCLALARRAAPTIARTIIFTGDREMIRDRSAKMALTLLRFELLGKETTF